MNTHHQVFSFKCEFSLLLFFFFFAEGKLTYQHANAEEKSEPAKKRRREAARVEHTRTVAEHFKPADVSSVKEVWAKFVVLKMYFLVFLVSPSTCVGSNFWFIVILIDCCSSVWSHWQGWRHTVFVVKVCPGVKRFTSPQYCWPSVAFTSPSQAIATFSGNIPQHCWAQHVRVWPPCCDVSRHFGCFKSN